MLIFYLRYFLVHVCVYALITYACRFTTKRYRATFLNLIYDNHVYSSLVFLPWVLNYSLFSFVFFINIFFSGLASAAVPPVNQTRNLMADVFKLISLNVKGISNFQKRRTMFTWCRKRKADIIFLQETHSTINTDAQWKNEWGAEIITCHGSSNAHGLAVLIRSGFDCTIRQQILDPLGRYIILKADIKDKTYLLINIYAPNKDKDLLTFLIN